MDECNCLAQLRLLDIDISSYLSDKKPFIDVAFNHIKLKVCTFLFDHSNLMPAMVLQLNDSRYVVPQKKSSYFPKLTDVFSHLAHLYHTSMTDPCVIIRLGLLLERIICLSKVSLSLKLIDYEEQIRSSLAKSLYTCLRNYLVCYAAGRWQVTLADEVAERAVSYHRPISNPTSYTQSLISPCFKATLSNEIVIGKLLWDRHIAVPLVSCFKEDASAIPVYFADATQLHIVEFDKLCLLVEPILLCTRLSPSESTHHTLLEVGVAPDSYRSLVNLANDDDEEDIFFDAVSNDASRILLDEVCTSIVPDDSCQKPTFVINGEISVASPDVLVAYCRFKFEGAVLNKRIRISQKGDADHGLQVLSSNSSPDFRALSLHQAVDKVYQQRTCEGMDLKPFRVIGMITEINASADGFVQLTVRSTSPSCYMQIVVENATVVSHFLLPWHVQMRANRLFALDGVHYGSGELLNDKLCISRHAVFCIAAENVSPPEEDVLTSCFLVDRIFSERCESLLLKSNLQIVCCLDLSISLDDCCRNFSATTLASDGTATALLEFHHPPPQFDQVWKEAQADALFPMARRLLNMPGLVWSEVTGEVERCLDKRWSWTHREAKRRRAARSDVCLEGEPLDRMMDLWLESSKFKRSVTCVLWQRPRPVNSHFTTRSLPCRCKNEASFSHPFDNFNITCPPLKSYTVLDIW